jgi:predicted O-methyltransferase YrrM
MIWIAILAAILGGALCAVVLLRLVVGLRGSRTKLRTEVSSLTTKNSDLDAAVSSLTTKNSDVDAAVSSLTTKNSDLDAAVSSLTTKNAELAVEVSSLFSSRQADVQRFTAADEEQRRLIRVFREAGDTRNDGQQRLNTALRDGVQDAKKRGTSAHHNAQSLSGELIHGSKRFTSEAERASLLDTVIPSLGLDWITERHLLYLEHAVPALEGRLLGRLAAPSSSMVLRSLVVLAAPDPTRVLEIGTLYGVSAAFLHEVVRFGKTVFHQTVIDPFFGYYGQDNPDLFTPVPVIEAVFRENMRRVGATDSDFAVEVGLAEDDAIRTRLTDQTFEVLIIDGDHSYEGVKRDFENYADHVAPGGYVIVDDYQGPSWPDVTRYVDETVFTDPRFEVVSSVLRTAVVRRRS